jgi:hypothetical protein
MQARFDHLAGVPKADRRVNAEVQPAAIPAQPPTPPVNWGCSILTLSPTACRIGRCFLPLYISECLRELCRCVNCASDCAFTHRVRTGHLPDFLAGLILTRVRYISAPFFQRPVHRGPPHQQCVGDLGHRHAGGGQLACVGQAPTCQRRRTASDPAPRRFACRVVWGLMMAFAWVPTCSDASSSHDPLGVDRGRLR